MTLDARLRTALQPIVPEVWPRVYLGPALEYIVFNYDTLPVLFADSAPRAARQLLQVHWYLPAAPVGDIDAVNPGEKKKQIASAIAAVCGHWPSVTDAGDEDGQHWVFECEAAEAGWYGFD